VQRDTSDWDVGAGVRAMPSATQVVYARTVDSAVEALSDAYSDVTVRLPAIGSGLRMQLTTRTLPNVALGDLNLTRSIVRSARYPWFAICLPGSGKVGISTNRASALVAGNQGAIVTPGDPVLVEYLSERCRMYTVLVDRSSLESELSMMLGRTVTTPLQFDFGIRCSAADAFGRSIDLLTAELDRPDGLARAPMLASRLGRLLMAGLLTSYRHNYSAELHEPAAESRPRTVQAAIDAIEKDPAGIETVADIARAATLSVRALDAGFRRHVGIPPMKYLRRVRFARAHDALLAADADITTATAIAHQWGFLHYGRFAAEYQRIYGSTPAESLKSKSAQ
jgi:AraC-like DNA-binding protein